MPVVGRNFTDNRKASSLNLYKMNFMTKTVLSVTFFFICFSSLSQSKKPATNKAKCMTFIYNLTTGSMRMKDICYSISLTDHIDMNQYNPGREWDKTKDYWKYSISIKDNEKKSEQNFHASFYVYEESDEIKQYHCLIEDSDFKALIFDKIHNCWLILLLQNDEYKILSCYSGYHYTNAFGIKEKKKSNMDY